MCSNKSDVNYIILINDNDHQLVMIAFDIKHNSVVSHKAGILVNFFNLPECSRKHFPHHGTRFVMQWMKPDVFPRIPAVYVGWWFSWQDNIIDITKVVTMDLKKGVVPRGTAPFFSKRRIECLPWWFYFHNIPFSLHRRFLLGCFRFTAASVASPSVKSSAFSFSPYRANMSVLQVSLYVTGCCFASLSQEITTLQLASHPATSVACHLAAWPPAPRFWRGTRTGLSPVSRRWFIFTHHAVLAIFWQCKSLWIFIDLSMCRVFERLHQVLTLATYK